MGMNQEKIEVIFKQMAEASENSKKAVAMSNKVLNKATSITKKQETALASIQETVDRCEQLHEKLINYTIFGGLGVTIVVSFFWVLIIKFVVLKTP